MKKIALMALAIFFATGSAYCMQQNQFPKSPAVRQGVARKITTPKASHYLEADEFLRLATKASQSTTPVSAPNTTSSPNRESNPLNLRSQQRNPVRRKVTILSEYEMYRQREEKAHGNYLLESELARQLTANPALRTLIQDKKAQ